MKKIDSMNLVPFIDIMLVLLVIVLTTASFVNTSRIQVNVPKVSDGSSKQDTQSKPITIAIDEQGRYYLNDKPHTLESLKEAIKSYDESTFCHHQWRLPKQPKRLCADDGYNPSPRAKRSLYSRRRRVAKDSP